MAKAKKKKAVNIIVAVPAGKTVTVENEDGSQATYRANEVISTTQLFAEFFRREDEYHDLNHFNMDLKEDHKELQEEFDALKKKNIAADAKIEVLTTLVLRAIEGDTNDKS